MFGERKETASESERESEKKTKKKNRRIEKKKVSKINLKNLKKQHLAHDRLANLLQRETRVDSIRKKQRFEEEFGAEEETDDEDDEDEEDDSSESDGGGGGDHESKRAQRRKRKQERKRRRSNLKPRDHRALFSGNSDDHFRLGIRLTRGAVTLYSDFDDSDIIVASPLGLATYLQSGGGEKTTAGADGDKKAKLSARERARAVASAADCLSSLELVVVDRADALLMQNWAHVASLLGSAINSLPRSPPACDVMRVRECHLAGQSRRARQLVVLSSFASPAVVAAWSGAAASVAGRARLVARHAGRALEAAPEPVQLSFERVRPLPPAAAAPASSAPSSASAAAPAPVPAAAADAEARFAHFASVAWPRLCGKAAAAVVGNGAGGSSSSSSSSSASTPPPGLLLFVPSYFDYVRVKKFLRSKSVPVADMGEYVPPREAARARTAFFARGVGRGAGAGAPAADTSDSSKKPPVALLTERSHFFHRAVVRGVSSAFFYQLPDHPRFFEEVVSWVGKRRRRRRKKKTRGSWSNGEERGGGGGGGRGGESESESDDDEEEEAFEHVPGRAEVLFSSVDALALERVVGTERCKRMLKGAEPAYVFC